MLAELGSFLWGLPLLVLVLSAGALFSCATGFFQIRRLPYILKEVLGKLIKKDKGESAKGVVSPFEAVSAAIGGTVGVGNIAGVASAIAVGGPGAIFWMWICGLFGMMVKAAEITLAVYYRRTDENGDPYGGPTFYMESGLGEERKILIWPLMAFMFGGGIFTTFFLTAQNFSVSEAVGNTFNELFGIVHSTDAAGINWALLAAAIIYNLATYAIIGGGIKGLAKIASTLVPYMCMFYVFAGLVVVLIDVQNLPSTFALIFNGAFNGTAATGGFAGVAVKVAMQKGISRSVYSNEAGWGSSPHIHASARTDHPFRQGLWGAFEVFIDTIVVCTITALVIINTTNIAGEHVWNSGLSGATLTLTAFSTNIGMWGRVIIAVSIFLFGLTTSTGWYVYYEVILRHLLKNKTELKKKILLVYKYLYPMPGLILCLIAVFKEMPTGKIWDMMDVTTGIPTFINLITIIILAPTFIKIYKDFNARHLGVGKVDPEFSIFYEDKLKKSSETL